jgi:protein-tyrosine phosphatase
MSERIGVLFVCLGNICRSPLAEGVFRQLVEAEGLSDRFEIDSAGTSSYHVGDPPDARTTEVAARRGVRLEHAARQLSPADLSRYHYVVAMDNSNLGKIRRLSDRSADGRVDVTLLRAYEPEGGGDLEVPDPYFGGPDGFEDVHDMVERACRGLLAHIRATNGV